MALNTIVGDQDFKNFQVVLCGSYRRGKLTCGDVDILISRMDQSVDNIEVLRSLIKKLEENLLVDHLG